MTGVLAIILPQPQRDEDSVRQIWQSGSDKSLQHRHHLLDAEPFADRFLRAVTGATVTRIRAPRVDTPSPRRLIVTPLRHLFLALTSPLQ
jgi:hypothetical protein